MTAIRSHVGICVQTQNMQDVDGASYFTGLLRETKVLKKIRSLER